MCIVMGSIAVDDGSVIFACVDINVFALCSGVLLYEAAPAF